MSNISLPIGIEDFREMITKDYYYIDKTWFIKELLDKKGKANLFTRPRRFGKTLNMSMLRYFFEIPMEEKENRNLFEGLKIMEAGERYTREQGQYPVIVLTLKSAKQPDFEMACASMKDDIGREYARHNVILRFGDLSEANRDKFIRIRDGKADQIEYAKSLLFLSQCLYEYYKKTVIILIDEYDVPLENAYYRGYYDEMTDFIRSLFESALKTNPYLEFSVITGCLRISRESIFTGLNNLEMISILNGDYGEYFGFVEAEVEQMLRFYHRESRMTVMKEWYDGYRFGNAEVYNPWSVVNFMKALCADEDAFPVSAWSNSSSNNIVRDLICRADEEVKGEVELLINGGAIEKPIHEDITYGDIYDSEDNLWNFLFFTGYLKLIDKRMAEEIIYVTFAIPNLEVRGIYKNTISKWFRDEVKVRDLSGMYEAMLSGNAEIFEEELGRQLQGSISYMDSKEMFYHGFLLGLLANLRDYLKKSNKVNSAGGRREGALGHREAGLGRYDICVYKYDVSVPPVILELKVAERYKELDSACEAALKQIAEKQYDFDLAEEGYTEVICYGIAFFKKQVRIHMERKQLEL